MDPVLHDILRDGMHKYLNGQEQTFYAVDDPSERGYQRLQESQLAIGWNNLFRGKYSTHWRRIQRQYKQDQSSMRTSQTQPVHSQQDTTLKPKKSPKRRTDVFQQVFNKTTTIIHEMWLERNKDRHEPMQGQLRIAKLTEATRTVETLYSL